MNKTFSQKTKEEIIKKKFKSCCKKALISAFLNSNFNINNNFEGEIKLSSNLIIRTTFQILKSTLINLDLSYKVLKYSKYKSYTLIIKNYKKLFDYLNIDPKIIKSFKPNHCIRAYIAGLFIINGSVSNPINSNYHLELQFKQEKLVNHFLNLVKIFNFNFKKILRGNYIICYIKKAVLISDFLKLIDASSSVFDFENKRIERDFINNINRLNNIDIHNYQKIIKSAQNQIIMINKIKNSNLYKKEKNNFKLICKLRLENKEASLLELSKLIYKKYNIKISKSGVNHLFIKLKKIYNILKNIENN